MSPLDRLTPTQRRVLRALHESGWLYKRASAQLGVPESTLRTTVHRAVARAGVSDRAELAYWLGVDDERGSGSRATLHGTGSVDGGVLGRPGRPNGRAA